MKKILCLFLLLLATIAGCTAPKTTTPDSAPAARELVRSTAVSWTRFYESIPGDSTVTYYSHGGFDVTGAHEAFVFLKSNDLYPVNDGLLFQFDLAALPTLCPWRIGVAPEFTDPTNSLAGDHAFWLTVQTTNSPYLMFVETGDGPFVMLPTDRPYILLKADGSAEYGVNYGLQKPFFISTRSVSSKESYRVIAYTATQDSNQVEGVRNATTALP